MQPLGAGARPSPRLLVAVLGAIALLAWVALWRLDQSALGGRPHHGAAASGGWLVAVLFLAGWLLMSVAMMLPTAVPLVALFSRMVSRRPRQPALVASLLGGYLAAWLGFGASVLALLAGAGRVGIGGEGPPGGWWSAGLFLLAGAFQFSSLKYACLDECRTPFGFLTSHWSGGGGPLAAARLGWRHGWFCVGCCWALMLLMFAVGVASLGWMLLLALVMALEKNAPWGRRLSRPVGLALLSTGVLLGVRLLLG